MLVEKNAPLQQYNTFGIVARAANLVRVQSEQDIRDFLASPPLGASRQVLVLGGGSNIVITGDVEPTVFKMEILGKRLVAETDLAKTQPKRGFGGIVKDVFSGNVRQYGMLIALVLFE